ncbi:22218_t:CDS:2 [Rhizophagus irregularis]|nr:22218_t:CDS:2 [Rhizophagus irregularis]
MERRGVLEYSIEGEHECNEFWATVLGSLSVINESRRLTYTPGEGLTESPGEE